MKKSSVVPLRQLTLPGGFCIKVSVRKNLSGAYGWWQKGSEGGTIVLDGAEPAWRRLKTFGHELVHATHDYAHWLDQQAEKLKEEGDATLRALKEEEE